MSAHAVDHHEPPDPLLPPTSASSYAPLDPSSCSSSSASLPLQILPQTTYSPPRAVRPGQQLLSIDTTLNVNPHHQRQPQSFDEPPSPDPREFYLQYLNAFGYDGAGPYDDDDSVSRVTDTSSVNPSQISIGSPVSRRDRQRSSSRSRLHRSPSTSTARSSRDPPSPTHSRQSQSPSSARLRQPSLRFKSLVDKYNGTPDEVLPRPPGSIGESRGTSPSAFARSGTRPQTNRVTSDGCNDKPPSSANPRGSDREGSLSVPAANDPSPVSPFRGAAAVRRPLFGEIVPASDDLPAQQGRQRSGSDVIMRTPNSLFVDVSTGFSKRVDPHSPTAWYLGYNSLDKIDLTTHRVVHKRSRSDLGGDLSAMAASMHGSSDSLSPNAFAKPANRGPPRSPSRIPVPARRPSHASDSGSSTPSTRTNSASDRHVGNAQLTSRGIGTSALPVRPPRTTSSSQFRNDSSKSPVRLGVTSPPRQRGTGRHDQLQSQKSPKVKAYISAPPQKKSPPLRSSRPRQPVSMATTTSSRAKIVDRISNFNNSANASSRSDAGRANRQKSRRIPELGNVDFAARRQQIQQAFNKSIKEANAKKEERAVRRRQLAKEKENKNEPNDQKMQQKQKQGETKEDAQLQSPTPTEPKTPAPPITDTADTPVSENRPSTPHSPEGGHEEFVTPEEGPSPRVTDSPAKDDKDPLHEPIAQSLADTDSQPEEAVIPIAIVVPRSQTPDRGRPVSPPSAATDTTIFDTGAQSDLPTHRTMLSQIMQMRESSTPSVSSFEDDEADDDDDLSLDHDDKESIQIVLRRSGYYAESTDASSSDNQYEQEDYSRLSDGQQRWSLGSWTSSLRERYRSAPESHPPPAESVLVTDIKDDSSQAAVESLSSSQLVLPATRYDPDEANAKGEPEPAAEAAESSSQRPATDGVRTSMDISQQYPDLIKQAGWDSKRATQLYFQELAKLGFDSSRFSAVLELGKAEPETSTQNQGDEHTTDGLAEDAVIVPESSDIPQSDYTQHRASLSFRDDWEQASTSIVDWMKHAEAEEEMTKNVQENRPEGEGGETPRAEPSLKADEGLGVTIRIQSSQLDDSPTIPPPPLPDYDPPPPPPIEKDPVLTGEVSPSIYSINPPSSILPSAPFCPPAQEYGTTQENRSSEGSSFLHVGITTSPEGHASSATSQAPSTGDQATVDPPAPRQSPTPEQRQLRKRANVIKELVDTEYTFGKDMKVVVDIYKGTSSSCLDLSPEDIRTLFGNSEQIERFSIAFQDSLKQAAKSVYVLSRDQLWLTQRESKHTDAENGQQEEGSKPIVLDDQKDRETFIGRAFLDHVERMGKVYADYLKNHDAANKKLEALQKNKKVNIWLRECRAWAADLTTAWNLDALLVKPVQRITKYPLLLTELLSATPTDHPDHDNIANALREVTAISHRINEMKKRADVVTQVIAGRKRKESDVRSGLSKAFGRRTEKLKHYVGLVETYSDKEYDVLAQQFSDNFFRLQLIMRDVEEYTDELQRFLGNFMDYVLAIESFVQVPRSSYPELESKWCRFGLAVKDVMTVAAPSHLNAVRKHVIDPMVTLLKLHDGPQQVMVKRNKRLYEYVKLRAIQNRGGEPSRRTKEYGNQFVALNETLKDELPKLISLTGQLVEACLGNYVQLQMEWQTVMQKILGSVLDQHPQDLAQIINDWSGDFSFSEAQVLSLGICNGSILADTGNLNNFGSPSTSNEPRTSSSSRRPSTVNSVATRGFSTENTASPKISLDFNSRPSNSFAQQQLPAGSHPDNNSDRARGSLESRGRTNSTFTGRSEIPSLASLLNVSSRTSVNSGPVPTSNAFRATTTSEASPSLPQLHLDTPRLQEFLSDPVFLANARGNTPPDPDEHPSSPAAASRYSNLFSSAMPMSESVPDAPAEDKRDQNPEGEGQDKEEPKPTTPPKVPVMFVAASMYEFNIDRSRREAGYPYLTYVCGEIFDVLAEKGDLWLARNQDDPTGLVGWIWCRHFVKIG
ncbi:hypothetical protein VTO42DRAFT_7615 [Malbranchea cinnamomea]